MSKIGVFYGPELGSVEKVAKLIAKSFGEDKVVLIPVKNAGVDELNRFDKLIFGASTIGKANWNSEHKDTDWDVFATKLEEANWAGKKVALYGLGDHIQYPQHFVDCLGWMYERLAGLDVEVVGFCSASDYDFEESEGVSDGQFYGLPVDEDSEPEKTEGRVITWVNTLTKEFGF